MWIVFIVKLGGINARYVKLWQSMTRRRGLSASVIESAKGGNEESAPSWFRASISTCPPLHGLYKAAAGVRTGVLSSLGSWALLEMTSAGDGSSRSFAELSGA